MTAELTPWFNGQIKPVRPGVYEREFPNRALYAEWTGVQWLCARLSVKGAIKERDVSLQQDTIHWRGLAQEPK